MDIRNTQQGLLRPNLPSSSASLPAADAPELGHAARQPAGEGIGIGTQPAPMPPLAQAASEPDTAESLQPFLHESPRVRDFIDMVGQIPASLLPELGPELLNNASKLPSRQALDLVRALGISLEPRSESNPHGYDPYHCPYNAAISAARWDQIRVLLEFGVLPGPPVLLAYEFLPPVVKDLLRPYVQDDLAGAEIERMGAQLPPDWVDMLDGEGGYSSTAALDVAASSTSSISATSSTSSTSSTASSSSAGSTNAVRPD